MPFEPGSFPVPVPHPMGGVISAAFDATGAYLIAGHRVFTDKGSFDLDEPSRETEVLRTIAHPTLPLVARLTRSDARLELVDLRTRVRKPVDGVATDAVFSRTGQHLAVVRPESSQVRLIDLDGRQTGALEFPASKVTSNEPALCFSPDDKALTVFPDHNTRVVLPLLGGAAQTTALPPVKFSQWTVNRALPLGADTFLFDFNAWRLIREDGSVAWKGKGDHNGAVVLPGQASIALIRMVKRTIVFLDVATGKEQAVLKIKPAFAPLGFACTSTLAAYTTTGGLEVVSLPPELSSAAKRPKPKTTKKR